MSLHFEIVRSTDRLLRVLRQELCATENRSWILMKYGGEDDVLFRGESDTSWVYMMKSKLLFENNTCTHRNYSVIDIAERLCGIIKGLAIDDTRQIQTVYCSNCARVNDNLRIRCKHVDDIRKSVISSDNHLQTLYVIDMNMNMNTNYDDINANHQQQQPVSKQPSKSDNIFLPKIREFKSILSFHTQEKLRNSKQGGGMDGWLRTIIDDEILASERELTRDSSSRSNNNSSSSRCLSWRTGGGNSSSTSSSSSSSSSFSSSMLLYQDRLNRNIRRLYTNLCEDKMNIDKYDVDGKKGVMFRVNVCHVVSMIIKSIMCTRRIRKSDRNNRKRSSSHLLCT